MAIIAIPASSARNCLIDCFGSVSCSRSGSTVTMEICRKPPAVNGMIQEVRASMADVTLVPPMATRAPTRPAPAVNNCALAASHRLKPELRRMAKSPTSCGISCTAKEEEFDLEEILFDRRRNREVFVYSRKMANVPSTP